jgi:diacylglycerol kinase (ATP)
MHVIAVINPISGANRPVGRLQDLFGRLRADGLRVDTWVTRGPGDARLWARRAASQADALLVVGGDGTVSEAADGLAGTPTPMLIWPTGTENLAAKALGYRPDAAQVLATLRADRRSAIDLGFANGRSFMVVAGVGFDAEVVHRLIRIRTGHISHLTYTDPLWRTFWEHRWPELDITADTPEGPLHWQGQGMAFVGNMSRYALNLGVVRDAVATDGLLDLCVMPCRGRLQLIGHALRTLRGRHVEHPSVLYARVTGVRLRSPRPVPVEIDGDCAGHLPLDITVRPAAIRVLIPA